MNLITIHGRLTRDPETKFFDGDKSVCNISVAVDRGYRDKDGNKGVDYFNCFCFGKQAETIDKYFKKGKGIIIVGEMQNNKYTDKDGNNRDKWQIKIDRFYFGFGEKDSSKPNISEQTEVGSFIEVEGEDENLPF